VRLSLVLPLLLIACGASFDAARAAPPLNSGVIGGTVSGDAGVAAVAAVNRAGGRHYSGTWDAERRAFTIEKLPLGESYDVLLDFDDGTRLEGVDFRVPPSDFVEEQPLTEEDAALLTGQLRDLNKFEDQIEVLAVVGNVQHAAVLVNKLRTRPFVNSRPGEVVWRCEVWHFERPDETWIKVQDELFVVLYRERLQQSAYEEKSIAFDPALGGLTPTDEAPRVELDTIHPPEENTGVRLRNVPLQEAESRASR